MTAERAQSPTRNATMEDLVTMLRDQHARKVDVVAPADAITAKGGNIVIKGAEAQLDEDGVTPVDGTYRPTEVFDEGVAEKLGIHGSYVRRLRNERPDLYDANVNGWLHGRKPRLTGGRVVDGEYVPIPGRSIVREPGYDADSRSFLLRCFRGDSTPDPSADIPLPGESPGVARAFLSDRYKVVDNLDALMSALDGVREAGVNVDIDGCDLTDRKMRVRIVAPEVKALAPVLLDGYRSPFSGNLGADNPTVFAGFEISNSETGGGAFQIVPRLLIEVCRNGMTIARDAMREVHLGKRLDAGVIRWSEDTQQKNVELIRAQTRDAVTTFLDTDYMTRVIRAAEEKAGQEVERADDVVKTVAKSLKFTQAEQDGILSHFVQGGQMTVGGVMNAVTSYAQTVENGDDAAKLEERALRVLDVA